jgi:hypothetical protein
MGSRSCSSTASRTHRCSRPAWSCACPRPATPRPTGSPPPRPRRGRGAHADNRPNYLDGSSVRLLHAAPYRGRRRRHYTVVSGDYPILIAQKLGVPESQQAAWAQQLIALNGIDPPGSRSARCQLPPIPLPSPLRLRSDRVGSHALERDRRRRSPPPPATPSAAPRPRRLPGRSVVASIARTAPAANACARAPVRPLSGRGPRSPPPLIFPRRPLPPATSA